MAAFRVPGYPALWFSGAAGAFGWSVSLVAISWITLQVTNSPFAVGVTFAARLTPALLFGMPLGSLVDRHDRRTTLVAVSVAGCLAFLFIAALAQVSGLGLLEIVVLSFGLGIADTLRGTAFQSYTFDLAGSAGATNAIALSNLGGQLFGSVGAVIGGIVLAQAGASPTFLLAAIPAGLAAILLAFGEHGTRVAAAPAPRLSPSASRSRSLILRNRLVRVIALVVIVGEILGFSSITLYPSFARDVLDVDAGGLGVMSAARAVGGVIGLLLLARLGFGGRGGLLLIGATVAFGLGLVAFSISTIFGLSLLLLAVVGCAASALDTLGQSLIQQAVGDQERGAAMGVWFFAIGFGPFGHLGLGAAASAVGAPLALACSGLLLALIGLALGTVKELRTLP